MKIVHKTILAADSSLALQLLMQVSPALNILHVPRLECHFLPGAFPVSTDVLLNFFSAPWAHEPLTNSVIFSSFICTFCFLCFYDPVTQNTSQPPFLDALGTSSLASSMFYFTSLLLPSTSLFFKRYTSAKVTRFPEASQNYCHCLRTSPHLLNFCPFFMLASFKSQLRTPPVESSPWPIAAAALALQHGAQLRDTALTLHPGVSYLPYFCLSSWAQGLRQVFQALVPSMCSIRYMARRGIQKTIQPVVVKVLAA